MRFKNTWLAGYWQTLGIVLSITVCSLWLAGNHKMSLYVHPRYIGFTVVMSALAVACVAVDMALRRRAPKAGRHASPRQIITGALSLVVCLGLLITRPTGLTSSAASQRGINSGGLAVRVPAAADLRATGAAYSRFTIKEWASLLAQTNDSALLAGKPADVTGFVSPAPDNNPNVFYIARFVITCCAVDAQPIGVPVYRPDWRAAYQADQWLSIKGVFMQNPEAGNLPLVLNPQHLIPVSEPADPYVY